MINQIQGNPKMILTKKRSNKVDDRIWNINYFIILSLMTANIELRTGIISMAPQDPRHTY
jgi:hypothetical protein